VVADLSFISLKSVAGALIDRLAAPGADVVVLVKPQFEAGRRVVSAGKGVIRDPHVWTEVLVDVLASLKAQGAAMMGVMVSPVTGADGNVEFLAHLRAHTPDPEPVTLEAAVGAVVAEAVARHGSTR
jgi:23S rRNA (cytidine1920-2'-O)/16S rRNA (cytidine1409-2'-O)-methyltransferase